METCKLPANLTWMQYRRCKCICHPRMLLLGPTQPVPYQADIRIEISIVLDDTITFCFFVSFFTAHAKVEETGPGWLKNDMWCREMKSGDVRIWVCRVGMWI
ncbi:unnamed protein product, partial [Vitis vinifera]|uniref:Uncharacterized protein n=1 Tax=Vitis vinifera TaxID=29760 RepID=D7TSF6_VITVI